MGYSEAELAAVPDGANLGLGCGNPQAIAAMQPGEIIIDLGSGAGFDCFLAARHRNSIFFQDNFCLIFVDFHSGSGSINWWDLACSSSVGGKV